MKTFRRAFFDHLGVAVEKRPEIAEVLDEAFAYAEKLLAELKKHPLVLRKILEDSEKVSDESVAHAISGGVSEYLLSGGEAPFRVDIEAGTYYIRRLEEPLEDVRLSHAAGEIAKLEERNVDLSIRLRAAEGALGEGKRSLAHAEDVIGAARAKLSAAELDLEASKEFSEKILRLFLEVLDAYGTKDVDEMDLSEKERSAIRSAIEFFDTFTKEEIERLRGEKR